MKQTIFNLVIAVFVFGLVLINAVNPMLLRSMDGNTQVKTSVDTLTFEQEMEIADSVLMAHEGVVYKTIYDVPNYEYYYEDRGYQTLVRYPNGMPKILVVIDYFEARWYEPEFKEGYRVRGYNYLFLSEDGRIIADTLYPIPGWRCVMPFDAKGKFTFNDPNLCRNLK